MENLRKQNEKRIPFATIDESLNKYIDMPLFENKIAIAKDILENSILPFWAAIETSDMPPELLHEKENDYIEYCLKNDLLIPHIAELMLMTEKEIYERIEEIKNTVPV